MKRLLGIWLPVEIVNNAIDAFLKGRMPLVMVSHSDIPEDAILTALNFVPDRLAYFAVFEHESFPFIAHGGAIPTATAKWVRLKLEAL